MSRHHLMAACAVSVLTIAGGAFAQTATATRTAAAPSDAGTTIGEIVVTAEKREANLQEVPEAVTAFTAQDRNIKGIETIQDMTDFTPGFTYSSQLDRPAMRGLVRTSNDYTVDSPVAVYNDDLFTTSTFLVGRDDMLIDQVEILQGPQGTLYGRNAIGGLINTISKRPSDTFGGEVRAIAGNYGYTKFEFTVTGPIAPHLNFRLSAYDENQTQGWLNNVVPGAPSEGGVRHDPYGDFQLEYKNDADDLWLDMYAVGFNHDRGGPGSLLGTPTAGPYSTTLIGISQLGFNPNYPYNPGNFESGPFIPTPIGQLPTVGGIVPGSVFYGFENSATNQGLLGNNNPVVDTGNLRNFAHALPTDITLNKAYTFNFHWTHHFDGFDVKYVGGYSQYDYNLSSAYFANANSPINKYTIQPGIGCTVVGPTFYKIPASQACSPLTVFPQEDGFFITDNHWFSHELTFSSSNKGPLQWIGGLYYYNETDNNQQNLTQPFQPQLSQPLNATLTGLAAPNPGRYLAFQDYQDRIQSAAAYAQIDYKITSHIKLTAGLRYTFDWKHAQEEARYNFFGANPAIALTPLFLGGALPAIDITPTLIDLTGTGKGICSLPTLLTSGPYAGDYDRCLSDHSQALTGTAGVEWTPNDDTLVYVRYNRGYKAFAFNAGIIAFNPEAAPEHVDDVEIGYKRTFGHNFTIDIDAFHYNYQNDQIPIGQTVGSGATTTVVTEFVNIPNAVSEGVELEAYWRPVRHLDLSLTYGFDYTAIRSTCADVNGVATGACFENATDPYAIGPGARPVLPASFGVDSEQAVSGNRLPQSPENKLAFNANYTFEFGPGNLILSGTYVWRDKAYSSIFTVPYDVAPSWSQVDLRAMWSGNHDRYEVIFYVRNLFNTLGYDAAAGGYLVQNPVGNFTNPYTQVPAFDLTPPRTFGAEVHFKF